MEVSINVQGETEEVVAIEFKIREKEEVAILILADTQLTDSIG